MIRRKLADVYPLSSVQEGILFHTMEDPGSGVYVVQISAEVQCIVPSAFRRAWVDVVRRHSILRTSFHQKKRLGEALQVVETDVDVPWEEQDWRGRGRGGWSPRTC